MMPSSIEKTTLSHIVRKRVVLASLEKEFPNHSCTLCQERASKLEPNVHYTELKY